MGGWMLELVRAAQMHDLDTVGIQTLVVDQPFRQDERLRRTTRLHLDLAL